MRPRGSAAPDGNCRYQSTCWQCLPVLLDGMQRDGAPLQQACTGGGAAALPLLPAHRCVTCGRCVGRCCQPAGAAAAAMHISRRNPRHRRRRRRAAVPLTCCTVRAHTASSANFRCPGRRRDGCSSTHAAVSLASSSFMPRAASHSLSSALACSALPLLAAATASRCLRRAFGGGMRLRSQTILTGRHGACCAGSLRQHTDADWTGMAPLAVKGGDPSVRISPPTFPIT